MPPPTVLVDGETPYPDFVRAQPAGSDSSGAVGEATGLTLAGWRAPWLTRATPTARWSIETKVMRRAVQELDLIPPHIEKDDHYEAQRSIAASLTAAIDEEEVRNPSVVPALGSALETALALALPIMATWRGNARSEVQLTSAVLTHFIGCTAAQVIEIASKAADVSASSLSLDWDHSLPTIVTMLRQSGVHLPTPRASGEKGDGTGDAAVLLRPLLFIRTNSARRAWARAGWGVYRGGRLRALYGQEDSMYGARWSAVLYDDDQLRQYYDFRGILVVPDTVPPLHWSGQISPDGHQGGLTICCALSGEILMDYGRLVSTAAPAQDLVRSAPRGRTQIRGGDTLLRGTIPTGQRGKAGTSVLPATPFVALPR